VGVREPRPWGVAGRLYQRTPTGWRVHESNPWLPYGDHRLDAMLASGLILELRGVTVAGLP
jgi:hypothetical protein